MKHSLKIFSFFAALMFLLSGCDKDKYDKLAFHNNGVATVLTSSAATLPLVIADAAKVAVTYSWTDAKYATDSAHSKYVVEIDSVGGNFEGKGRKTVIGNLSANFTTKEMNNILLGLGYPFGVAKNIKVRIRSSYANNNEMYLSNEVTISATPYAEPITLNAAPGGPFSPTVFNKDQVFSTLTWNLPDYGQSVLYKLQYDLAANNFSSPKTVNIGTDKSTFDLTSLMLNSYAQAAGIANGTAGSLIFRIVAYVNGNTGQFQYSSTKTIGVTPADMTLYLSLPGDYQKFAPYAASLPAGNNWGWDPPTAPRIASKDGYAYEGYLWVPAGGSGEFKVAQPNSWDSPNYGGTATTLSTSGGNLVWPSTGAYYLVKANTNDLTWSATKITTWGVIGDATPGGWNTSTPLTYDVTNKVWKGTINFSGGGGWKFRANDQWDINLGGSPTYLNYGGDNIAGPSAGPHVVTLDLSNPLQYTYTIL